MHPYALDLLISLWYSSKHHVVAGLPVVLSDAIVVGGLYGCLRLVLDLFDNFKLGFGFKLDRKERDP